jgi:Cytochrome c554 and c-prime
MKKSAVLSFIIGIVSIVFLIKCSNSEQNRNIQNYNVTPLTKHWEIAIPHQKIPEGLSSISAKSCGSCHQDIYNEWKQSTHAVAFQDLQFQAEWKKDDILTCLNCHTPLQDQQEFIVKGFINGDYKNPLTESNPFFSKELQQESITCATCHVRGGSVIGTIGTTNAPHKTIKDVEFLSEKLCIGCHNVVDELNPTLVCTFETGDEWSSNRVQKNEKTCITCHMPDTERSIFPNMDKRKSHFHNFPGSGIPKFFKMKAARLTSLKITEDEINTNYAKGDKLKYMLKVKNSNAGHSVPTGDPERFLLITFRLTDSKSNIINEEQHRIGEKWQWYPKAIKLDDNNLKPLEERSYTFENDLDEKGVLTLIVEITKHRMTVENAKNNNIFGKYPLSIKVFREQYKIMVE